MAASVPERGTRAPLFIRDSVDFPFLRKENILQNPLDKHVARHQVWPYALNIEGDVLRTQRTADVKHHLRRKCHTPEKLSTYEHDYTVLKRKIQPGDLSVGGTSATGKRETPHVHEEEASPHAKKDNIESDRGSHVSRFRATAALRSRAMFQEGGYDNLHTTQAQTYEKLRNLKRNGRPLQLTMSGWGDTAWSPARFPSQALGHTERQIELIQKIHTMNLRAPDIAHSIH